MSEKYVVALDQGTTSSRAVLIDRHGRMVGKSQQAFSQLYPELGWVEHDPRELLSSQLGALTKLLVTHDVSPEQIDSIGITNQRETTLVWDRETGEPLYNAIVWQCRRTAPLVEAVCSEEGVTEYIKQTTGLVPDAYFSASKISWILDQVPGARAAAEAGKLCFGTVDTWLIWTLTNGAVHATDPTNASRTMLYDIHKGVWDSRLCELFDVPMNMLPEVKPSASLFGHTSYAGVIEGVPICGVAGDQQAALFGQCCFKPGQAKNTYGTGCFLLMHTGKDACVSQNDLITTVAALAPGTGHFEYALEGSVFIAGALISWLRDNLGILSTVEESEDLAQSVPDNGGVYIVPAFTGLGAPYWNDEARGAIYGLTRGTTRAHIARAALEALAYQVNDLVKSMESDAGKTLELLNVDGGASRNNFLLQFQSDILDTTLLRPSNIESTALGAAYLAGLCSGFWKSTDELCTQRSDAKTFTPSMPETERTQLFKGWSQAITRTL